MPSFLLAAFVTCLFSFVALGQAESAASHPQQNQSGGQSMSLAPAAPDLTTLSVKELEDRGDVLRARKDYLDAVDYYNAAIKRQPTPFLYNKVAMAFILMGRPADARKQLKQALHMQHDYADAYNNTAVTFYMQKRYGTAIKNLKKAISIDPNNAGFHSSLGTIYMDNKQIDLAMVEYRQALTLDPEVFDHNSPFGVSGQLRTPADRARQAYEMAKLYASIGDSDRALRFLRRAMEEGYPEISAAYKEKSFARLREDERFISLMKERPIPISQQ